MKLHSIKDITQAKNMIYDGTDCAPSLRHYAFRYEERFHDFIVICDGKPFKFPRIILCQRSKYFDTITQTPMREQYVKQVELKDVDAPTFEIIRVFMYTNKLHVNCDNVHKILMAANYLAIDEIMDYCIQFLETVMTVKNYFTIRQMAEVCQLPKLKEITDKFFINNFAAICDSDDFRQLTKDKVVALLVAIAKELARHEELYKAIVGWAKFAPDKRTSFFGELFKLIDLSKMSPAFIQRNVATEELMRQAVTYVWQILQVVPIKDVAGGLCAEKMQISIIGGDYTAKQVRIFDVKQKKVVKVFNLEFDHVRGSAVEIEDGKIMCVGGWSGGGGSSQAHIITITAEGLECKRVNSMNKEMTYHASILFDDKVYVSGGWSGVDMVCVNEVYSIERNEWSIIPDWKTPRYDHGMVLYNGCLLCVGGGDAGDKAVASVESFDLKERKLTTIAPMNCAREHAAVVILGTDIYAIGGYDEGGNDLNSVEKYSDGKWSFVAPMNKAREGHAACVVNNRIFVVGGGGDAGAATTVEVYDPVLDHWSIFCELEKKYYHHSLVAI